MQLKVNTNHLLSWLSHTDPLIHAWRPIHFPEHSHKWCKKKKRLHKNIMSAPISRISSISCLWFEWAQPVKQERKHTAAVPEGQSLDMRYRHVWQNTFLKYKASFCWSGKSAGAARQGRGFKTWPNASKAQSHSLLFFILSRQEEDAFLTLKRKYIFTCEKKLNNFG